MAFSLITIDHFLRGFNLALFSDTQILLQYCLDSWSILVLIGIVYLAYRRFVIRPIYLEKKYLTHQQLLHFLFQC